MASDITLKIRQCYALYIFEKTVFHFILKAKHKSKLSSNFGETVNFFPKFQNVLHFGVKNVNY